MESFLKVFESQVPEGNCGTRSCQTPEPYEGGTLLRHLKVGLVAGEGLGEVRHISGPDGLVDRNQLLVADLRG